MLNLNFKILGEILVCHTAQNVVNNFLTMCMLNPNCKNVGEILVSHTAWGVNHLLSRCMLNFNCKNVGEILDQSYYRENQSSFAQVHVESKL